MPAYGGIKILLFYYLLEEKRMNWELSTVQNIECKCKSLYQGKSAVREIKLNKRGI